MTHKISQHLISYINLNAPVVRKSATSEPGLTYNEEGWPINYRDYKDRDYKDRDFKDRDREFDFIFQNSGLISAFLDLGLSIIFMIIPEIWYIRYVTLLSQKVD